MILAAIAALAMTAQATVWESFDVGDWENPTTYNGSYFDMAPTNYYVAHTGVQMLYTPDMLADMQGKQNVRLTGLTFMFHCETFEDITRDIVIFVQEVDATEFAVNDEGIKVLAKEIAKRIEEQMEYPGQIRVNVIRETRSTEYAK